MLQLQRLSSNPFTVMNHKKPYNIDDLQTKTTKHKFLTLSPSGFMPDEIAFFLTTLDAVLRSRLL
jgi:precorrin-6B methylase 1